MRARNIKPDFFRDAELAEVSIEARYLFIGLWCLADRQGKLKDQPKQIRFEVFPETKTKDDINILLNSLQEHNLITRYEIEKTKYIKVINFLKHQSPHHTEMQSKYPDPPCVTVNYGESPEISSDIPLIPDLLIPDSNTPPTPPNGGNGVVPFSKVQESWNQNAPPLLPRIKVLDEKRKRLIKAAWQEHPELLWFDNFFRDIVLSDHHSGKNDKGWVPDIGWILKERVRLKEKFDSLKDASGPPGVGQKTRSPTCRCRGSGLYQSGATPDGQPIMSTCDCDKSGPYEPKTSPPSPTLPTAGRPGS